MATFGNVIAFVGALAMLAGGIFLLGSFLPFRFWGELDPSRLKKYRKQSALTVGIAFILAIIGAAMAGPDANDSNKSSLAPSPEAAQEQPAAEEQAATPEEANPDVVKPEHIAKDGVIGCGDRDTYGSIGEAAARCDSDGATGGNA